MRNQQKERVVARAVSVEKLLNSQLRLLMFFVFACLIALVANSVKAEPPEAFEQDIDNAFSANSELMEKGRIIQDRSSNQTKMMWIWVAPEQRRKMASSTGEYVVQEIPI